MPEPDTFEQLRMEIASWLQDQMPGSRVTIVHSPLGNATLFRIEYSTFATVGLSDGLDLSDPAQVESLYPVLLSELTRAIGQVRRNTVRDLGLIEEGRAEHVEIP